MVRVLRSKRVRLGLNASVVAVALVVSALSAQHFLHDGWPLNHADPLLVAAAGGLFLAAYAFKAWGWQRLFDPGARPHRLTLAAAGGAASVGGVALPGRFDEAIRIAVVKRLPGPRTGLGAICLTLILVGLLDSAALAPLASIAAAAANSTGIQVGFGLVALAGVAAAALVLSLPWIARSVWVQRFRVGRWLHEHCACRRRSSEAWLLISVSWALRGAAVFVLLHALAVGASVPLALAFLCASAASAALPIAPAGAATQAGAGAARLAASGVHAGDAIAFAVSAQLLVVGTGAIVMLLLAGWHLATRGRAALRLAPALAAR